MYLVFCFSYQNGIWINAKTDQIGVWLISLVNVPGHVNILIKK